MFTDDNRVKAQQLLDRYPVKRSALLPLLHLVQSQDGFLSEDGVAECARLLGLTKAEVTAVATFYSMYKRAPLGRHLVSVCTNFSCKVRGAQDVYDRLSERLGVGHNQTTDDGAITLEHAECLGNCDGAPVVSVDYFNYECLGPDAAAELVERLINGEVPPPTRGYPSPGIREISHQLAGLGPFDARLPGSAPDQAPGGLAAPGQSNGGPDVGGGDTATEFQGRGGQGADEPVEGLGPDSGSGAHDYAGSDQRDEQGDPSTTAPEAGSAPTDSQER